MTADAGAAADAAARAIAAAGAGDAGSGHWGLLVAVAVLVALAGLLTAAETALIAAPRSRLRGLADKGDAAAAAALRVTDDRDSMAGALMLAQTLAVVLAAVLAGAILSRLAGGAGLVAATAGVTAAVLLWGQVLPRVWAIGAADALALRAARPVERLVTALWPVVALARGAMRMVLRAAGRPVDPDGRIFLVRDEIADAVAQGHSAGTLHKDDHDRLMGALDLSDRTVEEIMRHRSQIAMIDADDGPGAILQAVLASPHTRLPLFRGERENIVGVLHAKDLLRAVEKVVRGEDGTLESIRDLNVAGLAMKPYFVPETTPLDEQMRAFIKRRSHFALVVDEYGALRGLITLEDILEEIVGEIADEFDIDAQHPLKRGEAGDLVVDGAMSIRDLNRAAGWSLPDDEANTIAGLVIHEAQLIPVEGQVFSFHGFRFEVLTRKENRITRLRLRPL